MYIYGQTQSALIWHIKPDSAVVFIHLYEFLLTYTHKRERDYKIIKVKKAIRLGRVGEDGRD